ncbi:MAG TPA: hypothetical protein VFX15_03920 [Actinomycetes bacterium]|nr:hypothetical protein [Actinomycetes bacterium]
MTRLQIRTATAPPDEFTRAFPHLLPQADPASTTLMGDLVDQHALLAVLDRLDMLGIRVLEVVTLPDD